MGGSEKAAKAHVGTAGDVLEMALGPLLERIAATGRGETMDWSTKNCVFTQLRLRDAD